MEPCFPQLADMGGYVCNLPIVFPHAESAVFLDGECFLPPIPCGEQNGPLATPIKDLHGLVSVKGAQNVGHATSKIQD
jgi:hypothetical protein